jgi:hypothetical protein
MEKNTWDLLELASRKKLETLVVGTEVQTTHGVGTLLRIEVPFNGLYYELPRTEVVVWYGMDRAQSAGGFVSYYYKLSEVTPLGTVRSVKNSEQNLLE